MKKLLLSCLLLFTLGFVHAQDDGDSSSDNFNAGTIMLSGSSNFNFIFSDNTNFSLSVSAGYFLIDNLMAGINFNYIDFGSFSDEQIALEARYYLFNNIFGGALYQLDDGGNLALQAGIDLFLNDSVALEPVFIYSLEDNADPGIAGRITIFF